MDRIRARTQRFLVVLAACLLILLGPLSAQTPAVSPGDQVTIHLNSGGQVAGVVLRQTPAEVVLRAKYGTIRVELAQISGIDKSAEPEAAQSQVGQSHLPNWHTCIEKLAAKPCGADLRQIPATVIDVGILKYVPYMSHRAGDYEFNIYGDPEDPAGIEIGIVKDASKTEVAKAECRQIMMDMLRDGADRLVLEMLNGDSAISVGGALTFEITPPNAPDSYGGWWISIYSESMLEKSRAKPEELSTITTKQGSQATPEEKSSGDPWAWKAQEYSEARRVPPSNRTSGAEDGKTVYVRGYYRKDGTYVAPHTRRPPTRK